jgi:hypothetical protein
VDITTGNTAGRDALRTFLRADGNTQITDAELLSCWDTAVDATQRHIRPGYTADAPQGVEDFVLHVAALVWKHRDSGGEGGVLPDGTVTIGSFLTKRKIDSLAAAYGGPYCVTPRVIA